LNQLVQRHLDVQDIQKDHVELHSISFLLNQQEHQQELNTPTRPSATTPSANASKAPTKPTTAPTKPNGSPTLGPGTPTTAFPTEPPTDPAGTVSAFPGWIPGVVIFLIVLVAILLVTTIAGAVLMCTGGAGSPGEVDAYTAL
jgi:hypothetical protein